VPELGATVAELLLAPHRSYLGLVEPLLDTGWLKGMAHITGGGITGNLPRILPPATGAVVRKGSWPILPIFRFIQEKGSVEEAEMYRTFNMGIGMVLVVAEQRVASLKGHFSALGDPCYELGMIETGDGRVRYM
jgi:phosphoribosylformylglycinamidine cyclo-ligase